MTPDEFLNDPKPPVVLEVVLGEVESLRERVSHLETLLLNLQEDFNEKLYQIRESHVPSGRIGPKWMDPIMSDATAKAILDDMMKNARKNP